MTVDEDLVRRLLVSATDGLPQNDVIPEVLRRVTRRKRRRALAAVTATCLLLVLSVAGITQLSLSAPASIVPATLGVTGSAAQTQPPYLPRTRTDSPVDSPPAVSASTAVSVTTLARYDARLDPVGPVLVAGGAAYWYAGLASGDGSFAKGDIVRQPLNGGAATTVKMSGQAHAMLVVGGQLWVASDLGLLRLEPVSLMLRQTYPIGQVWSLAVTTSGLWVAYAGGLRLLDPLTGATRADLNAVTTELAASPEGSLFYDLEGGFGKQDVVERSAAGVMLHRWTTSDKSLGLGAPAADSSGVWVTQPTGMLGYLLHLTQNSLMQDAQTAGEATNGVQAFPAADGVTYSGDAGRGLSCLIGGTRRDFLTLVFPANSVAVDGVDALVLGDGQVRRVSPPAACQPGLADSTPSSLTRKVLPDNPPQVYMGHPRIATVALPDGSVEEQVAYVSGRLLCLGAGRAEHGYEYAQTCLSASATSATAVLEETGTPGQRIVVVVLPGSVDSAGLSGLPEGPQTAAPIKCPTTGAASCTLFLFPTRGPVGTLTLSTGQPLPTITARRPQG